MIGPFSKDIWGIIYEKLEIDFDPLALNNLSRTCKKLYNIDNIRKKNYEQSAKSTKNRDRSPEIFIKR